MVLVIVAKADAFATISIRRAAPRRGRVGLHFFTSSTRRFLARPSSVVLSPIGFS